MPTCTQCGQDKPLTEFYVQKDRAKPRSMQPCKVCKKAYLKKWYSATWRKRPELPEGYKYCPSCKRVLLKAAFDKNAGRQDGLQVYCHECWPEYVQKWRAKPETKEWERAKGRRVRRTPQGKIKQDARQLTYYALRFGYLVKQPCEICGSLKVDAHHTQYDKPLDGIRWLCEEHHKTHGHGGDFTNPPQ